MPIPDRVAAALGRSETAGRLGRSLLSPLDRALGPRRGLGRLAFGERYCILTTTGRRSGRRRATPLLCIPADGGGHVVAASNFGGERHPAWSYNLEADPDAELALGSRRLAVRARRADDREVERYWPRFVEAYKGYEAYRERAPRDIKLFVLEAR
jgi:deazaflavin-dependent oxidoreductase (nitroreductase family)